MTKAQSLALLGLSSLGVHNLGSFVSRASVMGTKELRLWTSRCYTNTGHRAESLPGVEIMDVFLSTLLVTFSGVPCIYRFPAWPGLPLTATWHGLWSLSWDLDRLLPCSWYHQALLTCSVPHMF